MSVEEKVNEFIQRRFPKDSNWTSGNCYYFALILSKTFNGEIYYDPIEGHFVSKIEELFFDYLGKYNKSDQDLISFEDIRKTDSNWYSYLIRDCIS